MADHNISEMKVTTDFQKVGPKRKSLSSVLSTEAPTTSSKNTDNDNCLPPKKRSKETTIPTRKSPRKQDTKDYVNKTPPSDSNEEDTEVEQSIKSRLVPSVESSREADGETEIVDVTCVESDSEVPPIELKLKDIVEPENTLNTSYRDCHATVSHSLIIDPVLSAPNQHVQPLQDNELVVEQSGNLTSSSPKARPSQELESSTGDEDLQKADISSSSTEIEPDAVAEIEPDLKSQTEILTLRADREKKMIDLELEADREKKMIDLELEAEKKKLAIDTQLKEDLIKLNAKKKHLMIRRHKRN